MPKLTLEFTEIQMSRIRDALATVEEGVRRPATPDDIRQWLTRQLRARVLKRTLGAASESAEATKREELETEGW